ncbi:hypothetical protein AB0J47_18355 [Nocardia sp. NPDC049737]|uniref:hypothetical protein n=1 Tax=Nocardia sp. NPDC049737 TaxID=3154358 RepID=UPI003420777D
MLGWQLGLVIVVTLLFAGAISGAAWLMYQDRADDGLDSQSTSTYDTAADTALGVSAVEILSRLGPEYDAPDDQ